MNKVFTILSSALLLGLMSCNSSQFEGYTKAETGLHYKFFNHDEAATTAKEGDGISFKYIFKLLSKDSVLVNSSLVSQDGSGITKFIMPATSFLGSVEDALMMMAVGDSASFIVNADSFFLKTNRLKELPPFVKTGDFIQADIKMIEIKTKSELEENRKKQIEEMTAMFEAEKNKLNQYLIENKISAKPSASGLIFIETKKGKGILHPDTADLVTVNYTGRFLNGTVFDSSIESDAKLGNIYNPDRPYQPIQFVIGQRQVIKGWDEAIQLMTKGSKAKLFIPSNLGYGPNGNGEVIPPYTSLIFEVELIDFTEGETQQMQGGQ